MILSGEGNNPVPGWNLSQDLKPLSAWNVLILLHLLLRLNPGFILLMLTRTICECIVYQDALT